VDDSNQIHEIATVHVEGSDHDFVGVVAEGRHTAAVEDSIDTAIELLLFCEVAGGVELEGVTDTKTPLDHFGKMLRDLRTTAGGWGWRYNLCDNPCHERTTTWILFRIRRVFDE
jgi:hypothetical protein